MRVIIAGGRDNYPSESDIRTAVERSGFHVQEIVSGGATGVDSCGEAWAKTMGIPVKVFPAKWDMYPYAAGPIRNRQMAEYADVLIAFPGGKGTANMIKQMKDRKKPVYVVNI